MITRVRKYIKDNRMLKAEDMVVAGVSGGADSIAMLHILKSLQKEIVFSMEVVMSIMGSGVRRRTGMSSLWKKSAGIGESLSGPGIIRFRNFPESGSWEKKKPEGSCENRRFRRKKRDLVFPENSQKRTDSSGLRWHIIATIWQRLCCIIWQGEPVSGDFPGYRR